jgi:hypothetical protein
MAIAYTTNYNFPLLDDGGKNWGAVNNGVLTDLDRYIWQCFHAVVDKSAGDVVVSLITGEVIFEYA